MSFMFLFVLLMLQNANSSRTDISKFFSKGGNQRSEMLLDMIGSEEFFKFMESLSSSNDANVNRAGKKVLLHVLKQYEGRLEVADGKKLCSEYFFSPASLLNLCIDHPKFETAFKKCAAKNKSSDDYLNSFLKFLHDDSERAAIVPYQTDAYENPVECLRKIEDFERKHENDLSFAIELFSSVLYAAIMEIHFSDNYKTSEGVLMGLNLYNVTFKNRFEYYQAILMVLGLKQLEFKPQFLLMNFVILLYWMKGYDLIQFFSKMKKDKIGRFRLRSISIKFLTRAVVVIFTILSLSFFAIKFDQFMTMMDKFEGEYIRETASKLSNSSSIMLSVLYFCMLFSPYIAHLPLLRKVMWLLVYEIAYNLFKNPFDSLFTYFTGKQNIHTSSILLMATKSTVKAVQELDPLVIVREIGFLVWLIPPITTNIIFEIIPPNSPTYKIIENFFQKLWTPSAIFLHKLTSSGLIKKLLAFVLKHPYISGFILFELFYILQVSF